MEYFSALWRLARIACTPADLVLAVCILATAVVSGAVIFSGTMSAETVEIVVDGQVVGVYQAAVRRHITVDGSRGPVEIDIHDGSVAVTSADCPQQVCRRTGRIHRAGAMIVCVPNHLLVQLRGTPDPDALLITY